MSNNGPHKLSRRKTNSNKSRCLFFLFSHCPLPIAHYLLPVACCLLLASCAQLDVFEKNTAIPNYEWRNDFMANGSFAIKDSASSFNIYLVLRHTDAYQYNNIWLNIGMQTPSDSMTYQKVNIPLGNDANGWAGTGMNDIWELRVKLNGEARHFKKTGTYYFSIGQIMRDNPLPHIMSAGLRIEKISGD